MNSVLLFSDLLFQNTAKKRSNAFCVDLSGPIASAEAFIFGIARILGMQTGFDLYARKSAVCALIIESAAFYIAADGLTAGFVW